jgi:hypothetical protein
MTNMPSSPSSPPSAVASLAACVMAQPWRTLGAAFLLGAWLGLDPPRVPRNAVARTAFAMVGSIVIRVMREVALRELVVRAARPAHPARPMHD